MAKLRGTGMAAVNYPTGMNLGGDPTQALVHATTSGSFVVSLSSVDLGQGLKTVVAQIAAETLGVGYDQIVIDTADTDTGPHCMGTFASRGTHRVGNAVKAAAIEAREAFLQLASEELEVAVSDLVLDGEGGILVAGSPDEAARHRGPRVAGPVQVRPHDRRPRRVHEATERGGPGDGCHGPRLHAGLRLHGRRGGGGHGDGPGCRAQHPERLRGGPPDEPGARPGPDRGRRLDGHVARAVRDDGALLPGPGPQPQGLRRVPDARPRGASRHRERRPGGAVGQRALRRQGRGRDDRELADPRHRQRHLPRVWVRVDTLPVTPEAILRGLDQLAAGKGAA